MACHRICAVETPMHFTNIFQRRQKLFKMCESLILPLQSEEMYQYETLCKIAVEFLNMSAHSW